MTAPDWRQSVVDYLRAEALPVDKFGHQPRLYALACRLGQGLRFDDDILFAAAWMHDLGVFLGHRPQDAAALAAWDHVPYTIARTRELLPSWGFPVEKLDDVAEAIRTHQAKEQLGAVGAVRALVKVGRDTRFSTFSSVLPVLRSALEHLPSQLRLDASKEMAAPRVEALRHFIASLEEEANGLLY
jgi:uncharacterized protein